MLSTRYLYAVLLYALTPYVGVRTPCYTARYEEGAVPFVGGCPSLYIWGPPAPHTDTNTTQPRDTTRKYRSAYHGSMYATLILTSDITWYGSGIDGVGPFGVYAGADLYVEGAPSIYHGGTPPQGHSPLFVTCSTGGGTYPHSRG